MFEVFTDEIEAVIKEGLANLYWYKMDLKRVWLRAGTPPELTEELFNSIKTNGDKLTKRELMEKLYLRVRRWPDDRRLELSRNFVRALVEHTSFVPQDENHRVEKAERAALHLREIIRTQQAEREKRDRQLRERKSEEDQKLQKERELLAIHNAFMEAMQLTPQQRGYSLETIFNRLMKVSDISVHEPFKIVGEQIDGSIKYDGHHYLVELRWRKEKADHQAISSLYVKVEGKLDARGIFLSMNGYSSEVLQSLPKGKRIIVLLLDGVHLTNVLCRNYSFKELMDSAIAEASLRGNIFCPHSLDFG